MITISLDEYGEFEKEDHKPLFVAGLIFDDLGDTAEENVERKRIRAYYKKVISDIGEGFTYPDDLHSNGDKRRDANVVKPVKQKVFDTLPEFLSKGTYAGAFLQDEEEKRIRDRKGQYHLFVMLKSDDGKKNLLKSNANMLARDDFAANRYFHMAGSVVNRIIFHNPFYEAHEIPPIKIDVATRATGDINSMDKEEVKEFKKQAYQKHESPMQNENNRSPGYYSIMNADIYRTLIAQEMINSGNTGIQIEELHVRSIQYFPGKQAMEFLYLSDSICSILGFHLTGTSADDWLGQITDRVNRLNSENENMVFGYDEIDNDFAKAWTCYERRELFNALSFVFDAKNKKGTFALHYKKIWFPYLERRIRTNLTPDCFTKNINELSNMLTTNNLDQEKLVYMMEQFELMVSEVMTRYRSEDAKGAVLYKLYDAGVTAFCHIGNPQQAVRYYDKCREYSFYAGIDAFLRTNSKYAVCLEDNFEWDKALEVARKNVNSQELASEMRKEILESNEELISLEEGKAISQMARILAEQRNADAEALFLKALSKMEKGTANYKITQSYLLHFYADMDRKEKFEQEATDYFDGRKTYHQRYRYISSLREETHSAFSKEYACYVLIRGLYKFGTDSLDDSLWNKLCSLPEDWEKMSGKGPSAHPWEIIYKYMQLLAIYQNDKEAQIKFLVCRRNCMQNRGKIIIALDRFADAEIADCSGDTLERDKITEELVTYLAKNFSALQDVHFSSDGRMRYQELEKYFTFMYR